MMGTKVETTLTNLIREHRRSNGLLLDYYHRKLQAGELDAIDRFFELAHKPGASRALVLMI